VVIPVYNRARLLERALRSIEAQRSPAPAQVIVVDDASTDDSSGVARAWGAEVIRHRRNLGPAAGYQTGLKAASEQWIALLDSDDEWLPHHLGLLWSLAPGNVLVACSCLEVNGNSEWRGFHGPISREPVVIRSPAQLLHPENDIPSSAAMFSREAALGVGGFRNTLCEDLDLWCRLVSRGRTTLSPRVGMLFHAHAGQVSANWEAMHAAHLEIVGGFEGEKWWSRALVERRAGVSAWDRFRVRRGAAVRGAGRLFARELVRHPRRILGVLDVLRHRNASRRAASRLALSGGPSVAVLPGSDPGSVPILQRYEVDLSTTSNVRALARLAWRPSSTAVARSWLQRALVRLAGIKPVATSELRA
jgi:glycosyltransferase involved in cell wall biosynthesis